MNTLSSSTIAATPRLPSVKTKGLFNERIEHSGYRHVRLPMHTFSGCGLQTKAPASHPVGVGLHLQPISGRRLIMSSGRKNSASVMCAAVMLSNARCSASGQTQTVTREAPTITKAPVHEKEKSPDLDDGGTGFPPRDDDGGGGGGGGGGGNWSGGFFLFGFLAFLGFLKDKESEEDYRGSRRR